MRSPVLFLIFNRPDTTARVFETIRAARPPRLYVAADGPRSDRPGDQAACVEARRIATRVDWPCDVKTLFQDANLGCKRGPIAGIDWFFAHEEEGVILEDDILPLPTFFPFCDELLERYRHDERVGLISGSNLISKQFTPETGYYFSRYMHIWGWAGWRRVWKLYDLQMREWPTWRDGGGLKTVSDGSRWFEPYWRGIFDWGHDCDVDWWSYQLLFACWQRGMLAVLPAHNQTQNLGFGMDSTHTRGRVPAYVRQSVPRALEFPLRHPAGVEADVRIDRMIGRSVHGLSVAGRLRSHLNTLKRVVRRTPWLGDRLKALQVALTGEARRRPAGG